MPWQWPTPATRRSAQGQAQGRLWGIPILLKDNIGFAGLPTTAGAWVLHDLHLDHAFLTQRLLDAGAIILGKTNLSEWANFMDPCMPNGFSVVGGQTISPYGPYDPSGSSTGSAVAVAAGYVPASVGSETSGSIIQPQRRTAWWGCVPRWDLLAAAASFHWSRRSTRPGHGADCHRRGDHADRHGRC